MNDNLYELIGGGIVALAATIKGVMEILRAYRENQRRKKKPFTVQFEKLAEVYEVMNDILQNTACKRFLILKTTNGGGRPRLGANIYASVCYEDMVAPFKSVKHQYQRVHVDAPYINVLLRLSRDGNTNLLTENMETGLLRDIYESEGVAFAQVFYLHESKTEFFYCTLSTDAESRDEMTLQADQLRIKIAVDRLREIFKTYSGK